MSYTGLQPLKQIITSYVRTSDSALLRQIAPFAITSFSAIYSILLITDGNYFLLFLAIGFGLGTFISYNKNSEFKIMQFERNLIYKEQSLEQFSNTLDPPKEVQLFYPPLTTVVNQLLDYVMRDFVSSWWKPINYHNDPTFEKLARERLNIIFINVQKILLNQERNDIVMSTLYGVANTLIIHMRECRSFEESHLSIDEYVLQNPQSPFGQLFAKEEQHKQLRGLSQTFLKRTLPTADRDSLLLLSLFKELLATFLLGSTLDSLSDPDYLNLWIIDLLSDKSVNDITATISEAVLLENNKIILEEPISEIMDEDSVESSSIQKSNDDDNSTSSSFEHISPPDTPEPKRATPIVKPEPISTTSSKTPTLLASLQSPPPAQSPFDPPKMIFNRGSVNFTIMDISNPVVNNNLPLNKLELAYIIQIERPAMEDDHAGSEGGGYVITRTYADFETFHTILCAKHMKRTSKIQLRLPLDATTAKSWLKKSSTLQQKKKRLSLNSISLGLEKYIDTVVQDEELGTDSIILPFVRKERQSEIGDGGMMVQFAEEFRDEAITAQNYMAEINSSRSLFSRSSNNLSSSSQSFKSDYSPEERQSVDQESNNNKWFAPKSNVTRKDSVSSIQSTLSKEISKDDSDEAVDVMKPQIKNKAEEKRQDTTQMLNSKSLSSMDVELLIETTYALVIEIFNLTPTNNKAWMRRSILNLLREIVRRSYAEFISEQYTDFINEYMSPDAIVGMLNQLGENFWPEGQWAENKEKTVRTEKDKEDSKQLARKMLMTKLIPNAMRQLIGDQNCNLAMDRIWARIQDPQLNRVLILQVMERIIKPVLG